MTRRKVRQNRLSAVCAFLLAAAAMVFGALSAQFCCAKEAPASAIQVKEESLHYLQDLRNQNIGRLKEINETLARKVEEAQTDSFEKEIGTLKAEQREHMLRQEFLDRLILQFDRKFNGNDLRGFLENTLKEMAKIDAISAADTGLWKFLRYASEAIAREPETREKVLPFLEGYMKQSVSNPVRPQDYLSSRNYTNGSKSETGSPLSRDTVGAIADQRTRQESKEEKTKQKTGNSKASAFTEQLKSL